MKFTVPARLAAASLAAVALAGCSYVNPITTHKNYAASDGTQFHAGDVSALNLIVIATDADSPATLVGTVANESNEDVSIDITFGGQDPTTVEVPAHETVKLGPLPDETEVSGTATAAPGSMVTVGFTIDSTDIEALQVPVLDGTLPEYSDLVAALG